MTRRIYRATETDNVATGFDDDNWASLRAVDAEQAAEFFAECLNDDVEGSDDRTFDVSVKSDDGSVKRFVVQASLSWSYSASERGGAT